MQEAPSVTVEKNFARDVTESFDTNDSMYLPK